MCSVICPWTCVAATHLAPLLGLNLASQVGAFAVTTDYEGICDSVIVEN